MTQVVKRLSKVSPEENSRIAHERVKPSKSLKRHAAANWLREHPGWHPTTAFMREASVQMGAGSDGARRMREVVEKFADEFPHVEAKREDGRTFYRWRE